MVSECFGDIDKISSVGLKAMLEDDTGRVRHIFSGLVIGHEKENLIGVQIFNQPPNITRLAQINGGECFIAVFKCIVR